MDPNRPLITKYQKTEINMETRHTTMKELEPEISLPKQSGKKRKEFSQLLLGSIFLVGVLNLIVYHVEVLYALHMDRQMLPDAIIVTQTIVTVLGGFMSYCMYQLGLKHSRNKYGIDAEGNPFGKEVQASLNSDTTGTLEDSAG